MVNIKKNFMYQSFYQILIILLPLVTSPYVSRILGAENLGIYSYTYSIATYFVLIAMLGINNYSNRAIAMVRDDREKLNKTFSSIFLLHVVISLIVLIFYIIYLVYVVKENKLYAAIQSLYIFGALFDINWFFFGIEQFKLTVTRNTIIKLATVVCIFLFVRNKSDLWIYVLILAAGTFISQSIVWFFLGKYTSFVSVGYKDMLQHLKPMLVLFIPVIAISLYKVMDKIMLGSICEKEQVGFFENAEKAINIPNGVIGAFGTVMLPKMSNLASKGLISESQRYIKVSVKYMMLIALALTFGFMSVADDFSILFWGEEFEECGKLIFVLAMTVPFLAFANVIRTQYLIPRQKDKEYTVSVFFGAVVNVIMNALLIPHYEAIGAAIGTLCAEVSVCLLQVILVRKELPLVSYFKSFASFIIMGIIMALVVNGVGTFFTNRFLSLLMEISVGAVVYIIMATVYLWFTRDQIFLDLVHKYKSRLNIKK
ncbi:flippase [Lacrimispora sp.]|uniref:flippase n=1 Tax=Lacrimispora sp. TaxID=2719234 RepID=UPI0028AD075E|nr:flippase [Lacrimispora sp.]